MRCVHGRPLVIPEVERAEVLHGSLDALLEGYRRLPSIKDALGKRDVWLAPFDPFVLVLAPKSAFAAQGPSWGDVCFIFIIKFSIVTFCL